MMAQEPKIGTVVLNYRNYQETLDCVASLKCQNYPEHAIVVVENGSGNESAQVLQEAFDGKSQITLIVSQKNLGFAKGNNLGIRHAREKLGCDYVFVLNSDTIVPDGVFQKIVKVDCRDIGAISPSVVDVDGNPSPPSENSDDALRQIRLRHKGLVLARTLALPGVRQCYELYAKYLKRKSSPSPAEITYGKYVLQGCSYFLTPTFFQYYTQLYPETFLYWEELNLLVYLQKVGLHSVAIDTPPIVHKGGQSVVTLTTAAEYDRRKLHFSWESYHASRKMFAMTYEEIRENFC